MKDGIFKVWISQYKPYLYYLGRMKAKDDPKLNEIMKDIPFTVSKVQSNLPYILHTLIALVIAWIFSDWIIGFGYFLGLMGHPIQGWMINALAHKYGSQRYDNKDNSRNNLLLSYLIFGEGLQNNHHAFPKRANFAIKFPEFDPGFVLCKIAARLKLVKL